MEGNELLQQIHDDPSRAALLEEALQQAIAAEDPGQVTTLLETVVEGLRTPEAREAVIRVLDAAFRRHRNTPWEARIAWPAGLLAWKGIGDLVKAEVYFRALEHGGDHPGEWMEFYRSFYASRGNWMRLEQFLEEAGARQGTPPAEIRRLLARTASEFNNPSKELSYWQVVHEEIPGDAEADRELERLYTRLERWPSLADLLQKRIKSLPEDAREERMAILRRLVEIYDQKMRAEPKVMATYQTMLDTDPGCLEAMDALLKRYEAGGRWPDYVKVLGRKIEVVTDRAERVALLEQQAQLLETRLAKFPEAIACLEAILDAEPERKDIADRLKDLYERRRDFDALLRLRKREAERLADPVERAAIYRELAVTATERLRKFPLAIEFWEQVLDLDPGHDEALQALEGLYEREKRYEDQARILAARVEKASSPVEQVALLERLALLKGTRIQDPAGATAIWRRILDIQPNHERAKRELRTRYLAERRWEDLEWFLRTYATVEELARTLEGQASNVEDPVERRALLLKTAAVWRDELHQPVRAVKVLEQVLALVPNDLRAASELITLYRELSAWRSLPAVYEVAIANTRDATQHRQWLIEAAEVQEKHLSNPERAFFHYVEAYKEDLQDDSLREQLERLAGPTDNWETFAAVLEQAAEILDEPERKVQAWLRAGEIYNEHLGNMEQAQAAFQKVLSIDPGHRKAIESLEALYRAHQRWAELVEVLNRRLPLERRAQEVRAVRLEIARILYQKLGRVDEAIRAYQEVLDGDPLDRAAADDLGNLLLQERRFEALRGLLARQLEVLEGQGGGDPAVLADLHTRVAILTAGIDGPDEVVVEGLARALEQVPDHPEAVEFLEGLLGIEDLQPRLVELLKGPFARSGRKADLADLLEIELRHRGDSPETLPILEELNGLYASEVPDDARRFRVLARIFQVDPTRRDCWDQLEEVAGALDAWKELADLWTRGLEGLAEAGVRVELLTRLSRLHYQRLNQVDRAKHFYSQVLDLDRSNEEALEALESIYEDEKNHPELLRIYRWRMDVSPYVGEKIAYAFKVASELAEKMDDVEGAIVTVRQILAWEPESIAAWRQLDSLYIQAERWYDLATVIRERIRLATEREERNLLRIRLAEVLEEKLENLPEAVEVYREILGEDPTHEEAVRQLERLFENPDVRVTVAGILLPSYEAQERREEEVTVREVILGAESDPEARITQYRTLAAILEERIGDPARAFQVWARAFQEAPSREDLVTELLRVSRQMGDTTSALDLLCGKVEEIEDPVRKRETHRVIAREAQESNQRSLAKRHFAAVLAMDEGDLAALDALILLHREDGEVGSWVSRLLQKHDLLSDLGERVALLLQAGSLQARELKDPVAAIRTFSAALDEDPGNAEAIAALEEIDRSLERYEDLVDLLQRKADYAPDLEAKVEALKQKGRVQWEHLEAARDAIETFREVLALHPGDVDALRMLDVLYTAEEDHPSLLEVLESLSSVVDDEDRKGIRLRIGTLLEQRLEEHDRAVEVYQGILRDHPGDMEAVAALERMIRSDVAALHAFAVLAPELEQRGDWDRLYLVYEVITEREEDPVVRVENWMVMGGIAENRLERPLTAFECYGKAFVGMPSRRDALDKVEALAEACSNWENVPSLLLEAARAQPDVEEALALRLHAAEIQRGRLQDPLAAAASLEAIVEDHPDHEEALARLDRIYQDLRRWEDLERVIRMEVDSVRDPEAKVAFLVRLAATQKEALGKIQQSFESLSEAYYLSPGHPEVLGALRRMFQEGHLRRAILEILEPAYQAAEAWEDLAEVYRTVLGDLDGEDRKTTLLHLIDVEHDRLGHREAALQWMGKALEADPSDDGLLQRVLDLSESLGAFGTQSEILLAAAEAAEDEERKIHLWHLAARTLSDRLGDSQRAEAVCLWILKLNEEDREALAALDRLYQKDQRWANLLEVLEREAVSAPYLQEQIDFRMRAANVLRDHLEDLDGAVEAFRAVLKLDDMYVPALQSLAELHEMRNEHRDLFRVLSTLADISTDAAERVRIQRRMAAIADQHLGDAQGALALWEEISRVDLEDPEPLQELQRLLALREDWEGLLDACEREILLPTTTESRAIELLRKIARVAEERLEDSYRAQAAWRRVIERQPQDVEALLALRRLYRESGDLDGLSRTLESLYQNPEVPEEDRTAYCEEQALLLSEEMGRLPEAIEWWNRVLERRRDDPKALVALERLYEDTNRIAECVGIVRRRADLEASVDGKAALLSKAAEMLADRIQDTAGAAALLEQVTAYRPTDLEVNHRLQFLYQGMRDWDRLAEVLLRRDGILQDVEERTANLQELARIYELEKQDPAAAFIILVKALDLAPGNEDVQAELWRITQATGSWQDYVDSVLDLVDRMPEGQRREHLTRCGTVIARELGQPTRAAEVFEKALQIAPDDETALTALTDLYRQMNRGEDLVRILGLRVEQTPDFLEKVAFQTELAQVSETLGSDRALEAWRKVLELDEQNLEALAALARLHEQREEWEDLWKVLDLTSQVDPASELEIRVRMARLADARFRDNRRSIAAWNYVANLEPTHQEALDRLQTLYGEEEDWRGLAEVYERLLDVSQSVPDRALFCERLAILHENLLGDKAKALDFWQQFRDLDPENREAFENVARLLAETEDWNGLVNHLEGGIAQAQKEGDRIELLRRLAMVYERQLEDLNATVSVQQRILEIDPGSRLAYSELVRLFGAMESWEEQVQALIRWKEHVEEPREIASLMLQAAGVLYRKLENLDRTIKMLQDVLMLDPGNEEAADTLRGIYEEMGDWEKVAAVHLRQEAAATTDEERARHRALAGRIYLERLKDRNTAILHFEKALELDPRLPDISFFLARAHTEAQQWERAMPLLEFLMRSTGSEADPSRLAEVHHLLGLCAEHLLDQDRALREYQAALKSNPNHPGALLGLGRIYSTRRLWALAKDQFEKALEVGGDLMGPDERIGAQYVLAEACIEDGRLDEAVRHLEGILDADPSRIPVLERLIAVCEKKQDWSAVIRHKQALAEAKADPFERFRILLECGDIYREKLGNVFGAVAAYKEALEVNPNAKVALLKLFDIYLSSGSIDDALYMLELLARAEDAPEKRARHYQTMAAIYREKLGDDRKAVECLNQALDEDPEFLEAFRQIDEILTRARKWDDEAENYRRMLDRLRSRANPELEFTLYSALGEIYRSRLHQPDYAITAFGEAARLKPQDRRTHEILAQLYEMEGQEQWDKALEAHRAIVALSPMSPEVAPSYKAMARLFKRMKALDKAFMVSSVLVAMGWADPEDRDFFEKNLDPSLPWFKVGLDALRWETQLTSPRQNPLVTRLLAMIFTQMGTELGAKELKDIGLRKKDELDVSVKLAFNEVYRAVTKTLSPMNHKVFRDEKPSGLRVEFLSPIPALVVGNDMLTGKEERELAFLLGRQLAFLQPGNFLAAVKSRTEVKVYLAAALKLTYPDMQIGAGAEVILTLVRTMERRMPQQQRSALTQTVTELVRRQGTMDFEAIYSDFVKGLELTSLRAGMLVCGSLPVAMDILRTEDVSFSGLALKERMEELVRFTVSEEHFALRRAVGAEEGTLQSS
ncbi:MAG TPA: tetratricopeptide repeat protein [Myxococcota bacterium]|nr:tetratricopeptide repeat protein [Myxococcota bacterium]HQK50276.1 tetratricopeptide repeat protein [Myxococcota bacterium]